MLFPGPRMFWDQKSVTTGDKPNTAWLSSTRGTQDYVDLSRMGPWVRQCQALLPVGRRGGLANTPAQRAARSKGPAAAATARKQRAQQHAKHAQHLRRKGLSRAQIAAKLGKHPSTISRYLRRWIPISRHEMLACVTGASGGAPLTTRTPLPHSGGLHHILGVTQARWNPAFTATPPGLRLSRYGPQPLRATALTRLSSSRTPSNGYPHWLR